MTHSISVVPMRRSMVLLASAIVFIALLASAASVAAVNPSGNNGTVKIDGMPLDMGPGDNGPGDPDNEPHVGCQFAVDWYGFDSGDFYSAVTFQAWPPTGDRTVLAPAVLGFRSPEDGHAAFGGDGRVYIGEDTNAGGGSAAGIDASVTYDLSQALAAYAPHPQQGYHVKLTVNSDGSRGADKKHKVFWVAPCAEEQTPPTGGDEGGSTGGDVGGSTGGGQTGGDVGGSTGGGTGGTDNAAEAMNGIGAVLGGRGGGRAGGGLAGGTGGGVSALPDTAAAREASPEAALPLVLATLVAVGGARLAVSRTRE